MKTTVKLTLVLATIMIFLVAPSRAENEKTTMQILTSVTWGTGKEYRASDGTVHWSFRRFDYENEYIGYILDDDGSYRATIIRPYYLSDTPDEKFDESKVGKAQDGKYIIVKWTEKFTSVNELIEVSSEQMKWKVLGIPTGDGIITIKRSPTDPWKGKTKN
jgi:hypothetical protein